MSKKLPLDVDDEKTERARFAGMTKAEIEVAASAIGTHREKSAQLSGDLSAKMDNFEKKGGLKKAMKLAKTVANMEPAQQKDFIRCFLAYCDALGVNEQIEMFEQNQKNTLNDASIAAASSAPKMGAEPLHH